MELELLPAVSPLPEMLSVLIAPEEILAEVFGAQPSDVEEMIRLRLEERSWGEEGWWPERGCMEIGRQSPEIQDPRES